MKKITILLFAFFSLAIYSQNSYSVIYEADREGNAIKGDISELMQYVQNGNPIRVGWVLHFLHPGTKEKIEMQHWTDAGFVTTLNGHVFAQIKGIFQQGPSMTTPPGVFLASDKPNTWVAIIGTTGVMRQKFDTSETIKALKGSGLSEEEITKYLKDQETMKVTTKWAVLKK